MSERTQSIDSIPQLVVRLYGLVAELERLFPGRRFTPDGHLVGSIGEVVAAHRYGLTLLNHSEVGHDARSESGVLVQIKATQRTSVALRSEPQHLLVMHITSDGHVSEVYNGPGSIVWQASGRMQKNGQRPISLQKLRRLAGGVVSSLRLP